MARAPEGGSSAAAPSKPKASTDPYASVGTPAGTYVGWDPKKYDVPIGPGYFVSVGMRPDVSQINNPSSSFYGQVGAAPIYSSPIYKTTDLNALAGKSWQQIWAVQRVLANAGLLKSGFLAGTYDQATRDALEKAMYVANLNGISLDTLFQRQDLIKKMYAAQGYGTSGGGGGGGGGAGGTYTQSSINLTSKAQAKGILAAALAQEIGRQPTDAELNQFVSVLNKQERANPTITTTTVDSTGKSTSTVTKQGNVDAQQSAEDYSRTASPDEASRYQGANYFGVLERLMGA